MKVAVVIPVVNCLLYTRQAFSSLKTEVHSIQWVFIDNGSTDATREWAEPRQSPDFIYIRNEENIGVSKSWNLGIKTGLEQGNDAVFVINNDIVFAPDCLDNLVKWLGEEEVSGNSYLFVTVASIGSDPALLDCANRLEVVLEAPQFTGFLLHPKVIERVGYFDENYQLGYYEDNDYHARLRQEGITAVSAQNALVSHYGSRTATEGGVGSKANDNYRYFLEKWGDEPPIVMERLRKNR